MQLSHDTYNSLTEEQKTMLKLRGIAYLLYGRKELLYSEETIRSMKEDCILSVTSDGFLYVEREIK